MESSQRKDEAVLDLTSAASTVSRGFNNVLF